MKKPKAVWCDLDGTLCDCNHRLPILSDPNIPSSERYEKFQSLCHLDKPNKWCVDLLWGMRLAGVHIIYVTGRNFKVMDKTLAWLLEHVHFHRRYKPRLFMRPDGDFTQDDKFKKQIYIELIKPDYDIIFCLEDRVSVVTMLRRSDLVCLQPTTKTV